MCVEAAQLLLAHLCMYPFWWRKNIPFATSDATVKKKLGGVSTAAPRSGRLLAVLQDKAVPTTAGTSCISLRGTELCSCDGASGATSARRPTPRTPFRGARDLDRHILPVVFCQVGRSGAASPDFRNMSTVRLHPPEMEQGKTHFTHFFFGTQRHTD